MGIISGINWFIRGVIRGLAITKSWRGQLSILYFELWAFSIFVLAVNSYFFQKMWIMNAGLMVLPLIYTLFFFLCDDDILSYINNEKIEFQTRYEDRLKMIKSKVHPVLEVPNLFEFKDMKIYQEVKDDTPQDNMVNIERKIEGKENVQPQGVRRTKD